MGKVITKWEVGGNERGIDEGTVSYRETEYITIPYSNDNNHHDLLPFISAGLLPFASLYFSWCTKFKIINSLIRIWEAGVENDRVILMEAKDGFVKLNKSIYVGARF